MNEEGATPTTENECNHQWIQVGGWKPWASTGVGYYKPVEECTLCWATRIDGVVSEMPEMFKEIRRNQMDGWK